MADAISLLRQFIIENKEFTVENDRFVFNDLAYPKDIKTNYLVYGFVVDFHGETENFESHVSVSVLAKIVRHRKITIHSKASSSSGKMSIYNMPIT